ncbi:GNAT family N-acetyltransferase [Lentzea flava]|uniref:N-acetyltransferase n=1 Tax=Lentzea flava TaxID=103732 RepID=A0ABQ2UZA3_9PSEU|nr:GNAT family N-acetyltransferase [Lentzea flava]MCP2202589.1 Protein N-acetyltransferase, RimJ/RimL family [Lentzea flava]GGU60171.1 N-acetyltransferase [Lentzea flava]
MGMRLRRVSDADAAELLRVVTESLAHLRPWMSWATDDYDESSVAGFLANSKEGWAAGRLFNHAITVDGAIVGVAGADRTGDSVEIGYWLHPAHVGRGHATAAAAELVEFAFALDGVRRVQIWHDEANVASSGVPRRLGFTEVDRRTPPREPAFGNESGVDVVWELTR